MAFGGEDDWLTMYAPVASLQKSTVDAIKGAKRFYDFSQLVRDLNYNNLNDEQCYIIGAMRDMQENRVKRKRSFHCAAMAHFTICTGGLRFMEEITGASFYDSD